MKKLMLGFSLLLSALAADAQTKNFIDQPYLEVNGTADSSVTPDEIYLNIVISESDTKNKVSVEDQERKMVDAFKKLGINTEKDLTSSDISSNFNSYFLRGKGVEKSKSYVLKVKDAITMTRAVAQLEALDIANVSLARVEYSGLKKLQNDLRELAVENAKQKATALVKPLKQIVGPAIFISDNTAGIYPVNNYAFKTMARATTADAAPLPQIDFEKIKVSTSVDVKFLLK